MKIITGPGRSGTSFVAQIIDKLVGLSGDFLWEEDVRAGMESKEIVDLNKMLFFLNGKDTPYSTIWLSKSEIDKAKYLSESILKSMSDRYQGKWVKDPLFSKTLQIWIDCHVDVEMVIICTRKPSKMMESAKRTNRGFEPVGEYQDWEIEAEMLARQGYLWDTILRYGIPHLVIRYEHMEKDLQRGLEKLFPDKTPEELANLIKSEWKPNQ